MERIKQGDELSGSSDRLGENVQRIADAFPEAVAEGVVDFDLLRQLVGEGSDETNERFGLTWSGKRGALQMALAPTTATLRPWPCVSGEGNASSIVIEGDNLEVLKLLQKPYAGRVKLIYIDPPYNTGNDFVYPDDFTDSVRHYLSLTGQVGAGGLRLTSNAETSGRFHATWLSMMYPRLRLARDLLRDDGILMVSIDDHEFDHLVMLVKELFGDSAFLASLIWNKQHSQQQGIFKRYHEYIVVVARNPAAITNIAGGEGEIVAGALKRVSARNPESTFAFPKGVRCEASDGVEFVGQFGGSEKVRVISGRFLCDGGSTSEPVTLAAGWTQKTQMESWFSGADTFDSKGQRVLEFYFSSTGKLKCRKERGSITPSTLLRPFGMVSEQTAALSELMGASVFDTPKPVDMIQEFVEWFAGPDDLVMDFFAGSGTTGHAVMAQNAADGGNRRYILVQLPEPLDPENKEQKVAAEFCQQLGVPLNIAELTKERLRRAGEKVKAENPDFEGDTGFRVYRLDSSNIREWDPDATNLEGTIEQYIDRIKLDRSDEDLQTEVLLKLGIELTTPIETREIAGKKVSSIGAGALMTCLERAITADQVEALASGIIDWLSELQTAGDTTVVFRDDAFDGDVAKTNLSEMLVQHGVARENVRSL